MKRCALIGCGQWGKNIAKTLYELNLLHSICESNQETKVHLQKLYPDVILTDDFSSLLKNDEIDKIFIATPAASHGYLGKQVLMSGKDLFIEKPFCLNINEADELVELAKKNKAILMVGHLYHYHPAFIALQNLIKQGELGEIKYIAAHRLKHGTFRKEENVLWSFSPHDLSMILSLAGNIQPIEIECQGTSFVSEGIEDIVTANFTFASGLKAHLYASWVHPYKEQKLIVVGDNGMALLDDTKPLNEKLQITKGLVNYTNGYPIAKATESYFYPLEDSYEPLKEECLHFVKCCATREVPKTDGEEGLRVLKLLQACQKQLNPKAKDRLYFAHETAIVEEGASIGKNTRIWHYSNIKSGSKIGSNCNIGQNVVIFPEAILGDGCKIQNNVSIYTGVICEEDVFLGPSMVFTNVKNPRSHVSRKNCYLPTILRKGVTIGANATIICGIELGEYTFIGAGSVVTKSTHPYSLMVGNPARQIGWMSMHGERLDLPLFSSEEIEAECPVSKEKYILVGKNLTLCNHHHAVLR